MKALVFVAFLVLNVCIAPACSEAQTQSQTEIAPASLHHSLMKGLTYKALTITTNMLFLRAGTRSWIEAAILTSIYTGLSLSLFVINDYTWDIYNPVAINPSTPDINILESAKRTTYKFLTYRITFTTLSTGILYLWTGSIKTTLTVGAALALTKAAMFYANDFAWDWSGWWKARPLAQ